MEIVYGVYADETRTVAIVHQLERGDRSGAGRRLAPVLLFRSAAEVAPATSATTYPLAERTYGPFNDRFLRTQVESTIVIRSMAM